MPNELLARMLDPNVVPMGPPGMPPGAPTGMPGQGMPPPQDPRLEMLMQRGMEQQQAMDVLRKSDALRAAAQRPNPPSMHRVPTATIGVRG